MTEKSGDIFQPVARVSSAERRNEIEDRAQADTIAAIRERVKKLITRHDAATYQRVTREARGYRRALNDVMRVIGNG
jgi:hypothetical protein